MTEIRKEEAEKMAVLLIEELDSMDMKNVRFSTEFSDRDFTAEGRDLAELDSMDMKNVRFSTEFSDRDFTAEGRDLAEFMISFNVGEDLRPISKVASGGEISRFMLAFKTIFL